MCSTSGEDGTKVVHFELLSTQGDRKEGLKLLDKLDKEFFDIM